MLCRTETQTREDTECSFIRVSPDGRVLVRNYYYSCYHYYDYMMSRVEVGEFFVYRSTVHLVLFVTDTEHINNFKVWRAAP